MECATTTSKGQITIPVALRKELGIKTGTQISFRPGAAKGEVIMRVRTGSVKDLAGILPKPKKPVSLKQIQAAIARMGSDTL